MGANVFPTPFSGIQETIVDAKGDLVAATAADAPARLAVGTTEHRLVAASGEATGLKYVADTTNYAVAAKGDLLVGTAADTLAALTVGANGTTLVADSSEATGLKWATASSGGMTLINRTTITAAATTTIDSLFSDTYENYILTLNYLVSTNGNNGILKYRYGSTTHSADYYYNGIGGTASGGSPDHYFFGNNVSRIAFAPTSATNQSCYTVFIQRKTGSEKLVGNHIHNDMLFNANSGTGTFAINSAQAWGGIELTTSAGTITGVVTVYGLAKS
jgi:hypothetical protein